MKIRSFIFLLIVFVSMMIIGCGNRSIVNYNSVNETNYVYVKLLSGKSVQGTVINSEPHQLTIKTREGLTQRIIKSNIKSIKRKPPVTDDFGKGISEHEIQANQDNKNTLVYGIGGGIMSFGASFFAGSMAGNSMEDGSSILVPTTVAGGGLGTLLFVNAGKAKDREEAIEFIQEKRRMISIENDEIDKPDAVIEQELIEEKKKQEELRQKREELLKKLQEKENE